MVAQTCNNERDIDINLIINSQITLSKKFLADYVF